MHICDKYILLKASSHIKKNNAQILYSLFYLCFIVCTMYDGICCWVSDQKLSEVWDKSTNKRI